MSQTIALIGTPMPIAEMLRNAARREIFSAMESRLLSMIRLFRNS
jgi:hypothetical protein